MGTTGRATLAPAVVLLAFALAGCTWRLETPAPSGPSISPEEAIRDSAAVAEARIVDSLAEAAPSGPGGEWLLEFERVAAPEHLDALGGVYVPVPMDSPSVSSDAGPTEFSRAAAFARDAELADALAVDDSRFALLLASAGLSHAVALTIQAEEDARAAGYTVPRVSERVPPPPPGVEPFVLVPEATALSESTILDLVAAHDRAQYVLDVVAARTTDEDRAMAAKRAWFDRTRATALLSLAPDAAIDPRAPSYVIDRTELADRDTMIALLRDLENDLADRYLAAFVEACSLGTAGDADRAWLLAGAFDSLVAAQAWVGGSPSDLEAFPGAAVATNLAGNAGDDAVASDDSVGPTPSATVLP